MQSPDVVALALLRLVALYVRRGLLWRGGSHRAGRPGPCSAPAVDRRLLRRASGWVVKALVLVLWVTGLIIIGLDTGFDLAVLFTKGKLLAKFSVVALLTLNGLALHKWALPRLMAPTYEPERTARIPALLGAFSGELAVCGLSRPGQALGPGLLELRRPCSSTAGLLLWR